MRQFFSFYQVLLLSIAGSSIFFFYYPNNNVTTVNQVEPSFLKAKCTTTRQPILQVPMLRKQSKVNTFSKPEPVAEILINDTVPINDTLANRYDYELMGISPCICYYGDSGIIRIDDTIQTPEPEQDLLPEPIYVDPYIFEAKLYPNPAIEVTILELDITTEESFNINLYNLSGQLIQNVYTGFLDTGRQRFGLELYDLTPGMYIVQVSSINQNETLKLQKI